MGLEEKVAGVRVRVTILEMILAEAMEESKERKEGILNGIDETYRAQTRDGRVRNNPPGEIHVRLTEKTRRAEISPLMRKQRKHRGGTEISANRQEQRYRLDSIEKAELFYKQHRDDREQGRWRDESGDGRREEKEEQPKESQIEEPDSRESAERRSKSERGERKNKGT